jgi:hypothetical protein
MQTEGRTACLLRSGLTDKKERTAGSMRPETEPAALGQAEMGGIASHFEDDGREGSAFHRHLRQPERLVQLARRRMEKPLRAQPEIPKPGGVGTTGLQRADCIADPEQRHKPAGIRFLFLQSRGNSHRQPACSACITRQSRAEFGDRIERQAAFQRAVEKLHPKRQGRQNALLAGLTSFCQGFLLRCGKRRRGPSLQSGNGFAERKKPLARQGVLRHGVLRSVLFLLCSYRFQRANEESTAIFYENIPAFDSALENRR